MTTAAVGPVASAVSMTGAARPCCCPGAGVPAAGGGEGAARGSSAPGAGGLRKILTSMTSSWLSSPEGAPFSPSSWQRAGPDVGRGKRGGERARGAGGQAPAAVAHRAAQRRDPRCASFLQAASGLCAAGGGELRSRSATKPQSVAQRRRSRGPAAHLRGTPEPPEAPAALRSASSRCSARGGLSERHQGACSPALSAVSEPRESRGCRIEVPARAKAPTRGCRLPPPAWRAPCRRTHRLPLL